MNMPSIKNLLYTGSLIFTCCISSMAQAYLPYRSLPVENPITQKVNNFTLVDTGQNTSFNNYKTIPEPEIGQDFYGQDAQYQGNQPAYKDNQDGTITDKVTGLIWQKAYDVLSYEQAIKTLENFKLANKSDWRLPNIKEAYSLVLFNGKDISGKNMSAHIKNGNPFINTDYFDFEYAANGRRAIDVQMLSSTIYQGTTMGGNQTIFGVNLADGRIKGYPIIDPRSRKGKKYTVRFVRAGNHYGKNNFKDNHDQTVSDLSTGLMWQKDDSQQALSWQAALELAQTRNQQNFLGHNDWRVPNAKELQSLVDYTRSPSASHSAAINSIFTVSEIKDEGGNKNYPFFWSSTTHRNNRSDASAVYICFGEALGFFKAPKSSAKRKLIDVHGAGAQRSDRKTGNASDFPQGHGPQGDVVRIQHHVRLVRDL